MSRALNVIDGGFARPQDAEEPDWSLLIPDPSIGSSDNAQRWRKLAHTEWVRITDALREAGTLAPENRHQIQRLVLAYIRYDLATSKLFADQAIVESKKTKVPMLNLWQVEMRAADQDATTAEMELGIPPRRRGSVTKAQRGQKQASKADGYLAGIKPR